MAGIKTIIGLSFVRLPPAHARAFLFAFFSALTFQPLDPRDRVPPCDSLRGLVQELSHPPRRRNLRCRAITELALRAGSDSR